MQHEDIVSLIRETLPLLYDYLNNELQLLHQTKMRDGWRRKRERHINIALQNVRKMMDGNCIIDEIAKYVMDVLSLPKRRVVNICVAYKYSYGKRVIETYGIKILKVKRPYFTKNQYELGVEYGAIRSTLDTASIFMFVLPKHARKKLNNVTRG